MRSAEIRALRDGRSPTATGICGSSQFFDPSSQISRTMLLILGVGFLGTVEGWRRH